MVYRIVAVLLCSLTCVGCAFLSNPLNPPRVRSRALFGPVIGANRNYHTGGFRSINDPSCPYFDEGGGNGYLFGMTAEILPSSSSHWSIIPRIIYEQRPGSFTQRLPDVPIIPQGARDPVNQTVTLASDVAYSMLEAEVFYKYEFAQIGSVRFAAAAGPTAAVVLKGTNRQVQDLITPENARFLNPDTLPTEHGGRRLILYNGSIPEMTPYRFSLKGGIQAEIPLFNGAWYMTPGLYYDYGLTDVTNSENWQLNSIVFMLDFRHAF